VERGESGWLHDVRRRNRWYEWYGNFSEIDICLFQFGSWQKEGGVLERIYPCGGDNNAAGENA
jgi:hypothetical protein